MRTKHKSQRKATLVVGPCDCVHGLVLRLEFLHGEDDAEEIYGIEAAFDGEPSYMHYLCHLQLLNFMYRTDRKSRIV